MDWCLECRGRNGADILNINAYDQVGRSPYKYVRVKEVNE